MTPELLNARKREFFLGRVRAGRMTMEEAEGHLRELEEHAWELVRLREIFDSPRFARAVEEVGAEAAP